MNLDSDKCPSCGTPYLAHLGMIGVCAELQAAKVEIERLREGLIKLNEFTRQTVSNALSRCRKEDS